MVFNFYLNVFLSIILIVSQYEITFMQNEKPAEYIGYVAAGALVVFALREMMVRPRVKKGRPCCIKL